MRPSGAAGILRRIASKIEASRAPDSGLVKQDLRRLLIAIGQDEYSPDTDKDPGTEKNPDVDEGKPSTKSHPDTQKNPSTKKGLGPKAPGGTLKSETGPEKKGAPDFTLLEGELSGGSAPDTWKCGIKWDFEDIPDVEALKGNPPEPEEIAEAIKVGSRPSDAAKILRMIASGIDASNSPSPELVVRDLRRVIIAIRAIRSPLKGLLDFKGPFSESEPDEKITISSVPWGLSGAVVPVLAAKWGIDADDPAFNGPIDLEIGYVIEDTYYEKAERQTMEHPGQRERYEVTVSITHIDGFEISQEDRVMCDRAGLSNFVGELVAEEIMKDSGDNY